MNEDQIDSLIRTVLKIAGTALMTHGLTGYANLVNSADMFGAIVLLVGLWQSHQFHGWTVEPAAKDLGTEIRPVTSAPAVNPALASTPVVAPTSPTSAIQPPTSSAL